MRTLPLFALALASALIACSDDGGSPPIAPAIVAGGGVHDPGIDGTVNVYVIDGEDDAPLAGAEVQVGDTTATTDATGLAIVSGVSGPQTITAKAAGHAAAMWVGADGANVTIPLDRSPRDISRPPQATISGSITGWDGLPQPDVNHTQLALVLYSQLPELGARANQIPQPPNVGSLPAGSCARARGTTTPCAWKLNARPGSIALGLMMVDIDSFGTPDPSDDGITVSGFSVKPITVVAGMNQTGVMLELPAAGSGVRPTSDLGTPPAGLQKAGVQLGLDLGAAGVIRYPIVDPSRPGAIVPDPSVAAGSSYELLVVAREPAGDTPAESDNLRHGITDPSMLNAGTWLAPPTGVTGDRTSIGFTRSRADAPYAIQVTNNGLGVEGREVISVVILDASSQVAFSAFAPLPADPLIVKVSAIDAGTLDLRNFEIDSVNAHLAGVASDTITIP